MTYDMTGTEQIKIKNTALRTIREVFAGEKMKIGKIILFGSRARGNYKNDSDWDFLVVLDRELAIQEKHRLIIRIKRKLAKLGIPNDIIIQSRNKFDLMKMYPGNISYVANLEGVTT